MAEQSRIDRLKRLEDGRCPIHGIGMVQVGQDGALFRVECPRADCNVQGTTHEPHGPVTLNSIHLALIA